MKMFLMSKKMFHHHLPNFLPIHSESVVAGNHSAPASIQSAQRLLALSLRCMERMRSKRYCRVGEMRMVGMLGRPKGEGIMGWIFRLNMVMVAWKLLDNEMMLVDTLRSQCHIAWPKRKHFPTSYASCRTTGNKNNRNNFGSKNWFPNLTPKKCLSSYQPVRPRQTEKCGIFFGGVWTQVP